MREFKFRVWDKETSKMYADNDAIITFSGILEEVYIRRNNMVDELIDYKLMQYTGLKDKNGKEIYEGDIVKIKFHDFTSKEDFIGAVTYDEGMFVVDNEEESYKLFDKSNMNEVIGNIYEDIELLNNK